MSYEQLPTADDSTRPKEVHDDVTAYINAGGRGTRLGSILVPHPDFGVIKALLEVGNPTVVLLDHHIQKMAQAAMRNVVISAGDVGMVEEYVLESYNQNPGIDVTTSSYRRGNGGDLLGDVHAHPELFADRILVTNVDTILDLDESDFLSFHERTGTPISVALTTRKNVPNEDAFYVDRQGKVIFSRESHMPASSEKNASRASAWKGSSTGAVIVETNFIKDFVDSHDMGEVSLYKDIMGEAIHNGAVAGYNNGRKFFMDLGTVSTWLAAQDSHVVNPYLKRQF